MARTVCVIVSGSDRERLEAIASGRNQLRKRVERARVVLASARGDPVRHVAALLGVSRPMVWRWQQRFAADRYPRVKPEDRPLPHPPARAVIPSIDEKSQIQALDRTQPGLPLQPGRRGTMTHDYKRHG
ncbi:MAG: helix-turn-helix domain-containing protein, partial [Acetobacteraceae bacterium]